MLSVNPAENKSEVFDFLKTCDDSDYLALKFFVTGMTAHKMAKALKQERRKAKANQSKSDE